MKSKTNTKNKRYKRKYKPNFLENLQKMIPLLEPIKHNADFIKQIPTILRNCQKHQWFDLSKEILDKIIDGQGVQPI